MYEQGMYEVLAGAIIVKAMLSFLLVIIVVMVLSSMCTLRKTKIYRKEIADMYVAAKIKQMATKDNLDLVVEYELYKKWNKKKEMKYKELDDIVESELMEKVEDLEKKDTKGKK